MSGRPGDGRIVRLPVSLAQYPVGGALRFRLQFRRSAARGALWPHSGPDPARCGRRSSRLSWQRCRPPLPAGAPIDRRALIGRLRR